MQCNVPEQNGCELLCAGLHPRKRMGKQPEMESHHGFKHRPLWDCFVNPIVVQVVFQLQKQQQQLLLLLLLLPVPEGQERNVLQQPAWFKAVPWMMMHHKVVGRL
jgi:hypothetical protein